MTYKVLAVLAILAVFMVGSAAMALYENVGSLGDRVWWDQDKGGDQDPGEPGIVGATVVLSQNNVVLATQTTGADGIYHFLGLEPGTYQVTVTNLPAPGNGGTWVQTYDLNGIATPNTAPRELKVLATDVTRWLWVYNADGSPKIDPVTGDVAYVPNPAWNNAWNIYWTIDPTTGQPAPLEWNPLYEFPLYDNDGNQVGTYLHPGDIIPRTVVETADDVDFGYATVSNQNPLGAIGDYVWKDLDKDGVQDAGEPGIPGAVVELTQDTNFTGVFGDTATYNGNSVDDLVLTQTTNANGGYLFDNLPAGNYRVIVLSLPTPPTGSTWLQTYDKDDGTVVAPATFFTPNEMPNQLLELHTVYNSTTGLWSTYVDRVLDVDFGYVYKTTSTGPFFTYTQGGWGAKPAGNNPGMLLKNNWTTVFGTGALIVGSGVNKITLTSAKAVENFLPQGGTAGKLITFYTNPTKTSAGVFAGQVTALKLSVLFSQYSVKTAGLGNLVVVSGPLAGKTVTQVLGYCEAALSGLATPYTIAQLNEVATAINENFDNGTTNNGYLAGP